MMSNDFILDRLDQIDAKLSKPSQPSFLGRKRPSRKDIVMVVRGDAQSVNDFTSSLVHYGFCESLEAETADNGNTRIIFEPVRAKNEIEADITAVAAKFPKLKIDAVVVNNKGHLSAE